MRCVIQQKTHRGAMVRSYTLRNTATEKLCMRNERHIQLLTRIVKDTAGRVMLESKSPHNNSQVQLEEDGDYRMQLSEGAPAACPGSDPPPP